MKKKKLTLIRTFKGLKNLSKKKTTKTKTKYRNKKKKTKNN